MVGTKSNTIWICRDWSQTKKNTWTKTKKCYIYRDSKIIFTSNKIIMQTKGILLQQMQPQIPMKHGYYGHNTDTNTPNTSNN